MISHIIANDGWFMAKSIRVPLLLFGKHFQWICFCFPMTEIRSAIKRKSQRSVFFCRCFCRCQQKRFLLLYRLLFYSPQLFICSHLHVCPTWTEQWRYEKSLAYTRVTNKSENTCFVCNWSMIVCSSQRSTTN